MKLANAAKKQRVATMKLVPVLCLIVVTACCRDKLTQGHIWTNEQFIEAIDQDPARQDTWIQKEIGPDVFLVLGDDGNYIKRQ